MPEGEFYLRSTDHLFKLTTNLYKASTFCINDRVLLCFVYCSELPQPQKLACSVKCSSTDDKMIEIAQTM